MATEQQRLIGQLKAQGMSQGQIARAVGRDQSLISQSARGVGNKGASLVPALRELAGTGRVRHAPPRRMARVEPGQAPRPARTRGVVRTPAGIHYEQRMTGPGPAFMRQVEYEAVAGRKVTLTVTDAEGNRLVLFKKGGMSALNIQGDIRANGGDVFGTIATYVADGSGSGDDLVGDEADWTVEMDTTGGY